MRTLARQLLAACLAIQLPFCCCDVRAAMAAVAHAGHAWVEKASEHGCCDGPAPVDCCSKGETDPDQHGRAPVDGDCCTGCKDRAASTPAAVPDIDVICSLNFVVSGVVCIADANAVVHPGVPLAAFDTGPPWRPGGRATLALLSVLVI